MLEALPSESTVGVIARRLDKPIHRVEYVIRTRAIRPVRLVGHYRVFDEDAVTQIAAEIHRIDNSKGVIDAPK